MSLTAADLKFISVLAEWHGRPRSATVHDVNEIAARLQDAAEEVKDEGRTGPKKS